MFICMAGMPSSGKTEFVKRYRKRITERIFHHIDPDEYLPDNLESMDEDERTQYRVAAWEVCLDHLTGLFHEPTESIIVFDTAGATANALIPLFSRAKLHGHKIVYIFIAAPVSQCEEMAGDRWIGNEAAEKYTDKFRKSIPELKELSDKYLLIKNIGVEGLKNFDKFAGELESFTTKYA